MMMMMMIPLCRCRSRLPLCRNCRSVANRIDSYFCRSAVGGQPISVLVTCAQRNGETAERQNGKTERWKPGISGGCRGCGGKAWNSPCMIHKIPMLKNSRRLRFVGIRKFGV